VRRLNGKQATSGHVRALGFAAQYVCETCGHTGWSRHFDMIRVGSRDGIDLAELFEKYKEK